MTIFFFCTMVDSSWIFHSQLPLTHFSSSFFANYCHLISFFKKPQNCNVTNFYIISNLFHHKYNDKNFRIGNKKPVSLRNQSHPVKPISPPVKPISPCETNLPPQNQSPPAKPISPRETNLKCYNLKCYL